MNSESKCNEFIFLINKDKLIICQLLLFFLRIKIISATQLDLKYGKFLSNIEKLNQALTLLKNKN